VDEDNRLMLLVREGSERAFRQLFQKHAPRIVAYAWRFFRNRAQAEEVAQEVFLRLWRARSSYQPKAAFTTWLYTIASRVCLKEAGRRRPLPPEDLAPQETPGPDRELTESNRLARVQAALEKLPAEQRAALHLVRVEGLSYQEAAKALGLSLPAVKSAIFRATRALRRLEEE
jgi:RNA polymerase sigma-70 factor (ECF subfamily)